MSFRSSFLGVYAQKWDCWDIWQFYFFLTMPSATLGLLRVPVAHVSLVRLCSYAPVCFCPLIFCPFDFFMCF